MGSDATTRILVVEGETEIIAKVLSVFSEIKESSVDVIHSIDQLPLHLSKVETDLIVLAHTPNGHRILNEIRTQYPNTYAIVLLPLINEELITDYVNSGANGLVFKDANLNSNLTVAVKKALMMSRIRSFKQPYLASY